MWLGPLLSDIDTQNSTVYVQQICSPHHSQLFGIRTSTHTCTLSPLILWRVMLFVHTADPEMAAVWMTARRYVFICPPWSLQQHMTRDQLCLLSPLSGATYRRMIVFIVLKALNLEIMQSCCSFMHFALLVGCFSACCWLLCMHRSSVKKQIKNYKEFMALLLSGSGI